MADRRESLKIIGAVGTTCAFPFSADELFGQHTHSDAEAALPATPVFFTAAEFECVSALAELIIPATDTPGAIGAGVPQYIDFVVNSNGEWKKLFRDGLAWLDRKSNEKGGKSFHQLAENEQTALLLPIVDAADQWKTTVPTRKRREEATLEVRFLRAFKSMTADGYFTSKTGLVETLGYKGNTVLAEYPECIHEH